MAGKVVGLKTGETVTFGRAAGRAQFALPHDTFMSGVHFAVECRSGGCRVQDRKSSNGTFLNGARISDAMLANGDEIKSGQTIFAVKIVADAKLASMMEPQEVAPPSTPQPPRGREPVPPPAAQLRPSRAAEPAPSSASGQPRAAEPAPPSAPEPPLSKASAEPPPPVMGTGASIEDAAKSRAALDDAVESAERKPDFPPDPAAPKFLGALEAQHLPASGSEPRAEALAKNAIPQVDERPHVRAIPGPPVIGGQPQRAGEHPPDAGAKPPRASENLLAAEARSPRVGENPPGSGAKSPQSVQPRGGDPPVSAAAPVAQKPVAQKNMERPAARAAGSPRGCAFSVMGWSFPAAPAEWQVQEGFGLQQSGHEEFPSSVAATEELLGGITLQQFVESQISTLRGYLRDPKIEPTMPPRVGGADESMAMDVRHSTKDGRELVYRRIYARSGSSVGVLTVTTLAAELPQVLQSLQPLLEGAAFRATMNH
jgi:hypothetical protein